MVNMKSAPSIAAHLDTLTEGWQCTAFLLKVTVPVLSRVAAYDGSWEDLPTRPTKGQFIAAITARRFPTK